MVDPPPDPVPLESSLSSLALRKKAAAPRIKLPKIRRERYHPHFQRDHLYPLPVPQSSFPALNISHETLLNTVQDFRNLSTRWMHGEPNKLPHSPGPILKEMVTGGLEDLQGRGPYGIYIIKKIIRGEHLAYLYPHHREMWCPDRPDLYMLRLNWKSRDLKNPGVVNIANFLIGDAICVFSLDLLPNPHGFLTDSCEAVYEDSKNHDFWVIGDFFLVKREFKEDCLLMKMYDGRYLVEGFSEPLKMMCYRNGGCKQGKLDSGKIFLPQLQPMEGVRKANPSDFYRDFACTFKIKPLITEVHQLPADFSENLANFSKLLQIHQDPKSFESLMKIVRFGVHGLEICENQIVTEANIINSEDSVVTFDTSEDWPWKSGEEFFLKFDTEVHRMKMISIQTLPGSFEIPKRISLESSLESSLDGTNLDHLDGKKVRIYKSYPVDKLKYFSEVYVFGGIPEDSPIKKCLVALLGGSKLANLSGEIKVSNKFSNITFNPLQSKAFSLLTSSKLPAMIVDGSLKTGKSLLTVCTANHLGQSKGYQIVTAPTDYAVGLLVKEHMSLDAPCRGVWLGPKNENLTFERLWPRIFWDKLLDMDRNFDEDQVSILESVVHFAVENQKFLDENYEFKNAKLQDLVTRVVQGVHDLEGTPKLTLFETFLQLYQPRILFGTPSKIIEVLASSKPQNLGEDVQTVLFDDANRLPFHEFLALGAYCPKARFAFFGNLQQLPPSAPVALPKLLKTCTIGNLYQVAMGKLPKVTFKKTFAPGILPNGPNSPSFLHAILMESSSMAISKCCSHNYYFVMLNCFIFAPKFELNI
ncbi:hypothetical protein CAEBREN_17679 [Caenorhabditis brenneri]|uniref:Uncharacterized protein n=1 Tax=Caenorhabditis brenneri TaxID=135651 RepID=G0N0E7_CAEBE|nr:hypothetical protein CAEBREN_17679 [Caenorhabditis brenneri]